MLTFFLFFYFLKKKRSSFFFKVFKFSIGGLYYEDIRLDQLIYRGPWENSCAERIRDFQFVQATRYRTFRCTASAHNRRENEYEGRKLFRYAKRGRILSGAASREFSEALAQDASTTANLWNPHRPVYSTTVPSFFFFFKTKFNQSKLFQPSD